jgi:hypothetical protein
MKKPTFHVKNILGNKVPTIIGVVAAALLPVVMQSVDATTIGGALLIALVGALAGNKTNSN